MGKTSIEWTDASWNPIVGCTEISPGCANCYAARLAATRLRSTKAYADLAITKSDCDKAVEVLSEIAPSAATVIKEKIRRHTSPLWTGTVRFLPERLEEPLHWKSPRRIFVCDMGDLFHEAVQDKWIHRIWDIMASCQQHTFQILTKRAGRMRQWVSERRSNDFDPDREATGVSFAPLANVWLGVSVENKHFADERREALHDLAGQGWLTWVSYEPALGGVNWIGWQFVKWIVSGGESGPQARPSHPDWHRYTRDYCQQEGIAYFFKQWGEWLPADQEARNVPFIGGENTRRNGEFLRFGKKRAGRLLDGREWNEFPRQAEEREKDPQVTP